MAGGLSLHFLATNRVVEVTQEEMTAGSSKSCELRLNSYLSPPVTTISRRHFKIARTNEGYEITDLGSTNGTQVNHIVLLPHTPRFLHHGDLITLAKNEAFSCRVLFEGDEGGTEVVEEGTIDESLLTPQKSRQSIEFDPSRGGFVIDGQVIPHTHLTELEYELLSYLYKHAERACSHYDINQHVWGGGASKNSVAKMVSKLRQKLDMISLGAGKRYLKTSYGYVQGYMLTQG